MYEWKQTSGRRWLSIADTEGNRIVIPEEKIVRIYEAKAPSSPAFTKGMYRLRYVKLRDGGMIETSETIDELIDLLTQ